MMCDLNCKNLKCIATGECIDVPVVADAPLLSDGPCMEKFCLVHCGDRCDCQRGRGLVDGITELNLHSEIPMSPPLAPPQRKRVIDADSATRKTFPMAAGLLDYFPDALAEVSRVSYLGNQKHNPGEPMHHARGKSMDHADCILRHLVGRGGFDGELRESAALAWRALALLQEELEREMNLPLPRGARA